jgi:exopolyphosphatase/guanosine-5'-triphosphate,3'-diphosphate pyrophosphatase
MTSASQNTYAAIDLGSNSFHMIVAHFSEDRLVIIDRIKEMVRLASGLDDHQMLSEQAIKAGIACLEKFGQRLRGIPLDNVRVVGTNTIRKARNSNDFINRAQTALGCPIDIIAGREESRLIYAGLANTIFDDNNKRLVIDIGGGSTELIIGKGFDPILSESLYMGCVNTTQDFFGDGKMTTSRMRDAILFARQELETIEAMYRQEGWMLAYGTSGTINAIEKVIAENGWSDRGITLPALYRLTDRLLEFKSIDKIDIAGLATKRKPVFPGGVAILTGVFETLEITELHSCQGALREGLLYDLLDRQFDHDIRNESVRFMAQLYGVDVEHAMRVKETAHRLFNRVKKIWGLSKADNNLIGWAAELHSLGQRVAHSQYHKHGAYILTYSDIPGFSLQEQLQLASLIRFHRRKIKLDGFIPQGQVRPAKMLLLCLLLRLAVLLHRSRSRDPLPELHLTGDEENLHLKFPDNWLEQHPLTEADLKSEVNYLHRIKVNLTFI